MALITKSEVKARIGISDTSQDDFIDAMILDLRGWLVGYLNNPFTNPNLYYSSDSLSFSGKTISDSDSALVTEGFVADMDIYIINSQSNNGHYIIDTITAGALTVLDSIFTIEAAGSASPLIYQVQFPDGLKSIVSNMIRWQMNQQMNQNIESEKVGNYSISYLAPTDSTGSYPDSIMKSLSQYRRASFVK